LALGFENISDAKMFLLTNQCVGCFQSFSSWKENCGNSKYLYDWITWRDVSLGEVGISLLRIISLINVDVTDDIKYLR
jgi:hypothetical protein